MSINERDWWTLEAMRRKGGSFVRAIAEAAWHADPINLNKLKEAWPEYFAEYEAFGKDLEREHEGNSADSMAKEPEYVERSGMAVLQWLTDMRSRGLIIFTNGDGVEAPLEDMQESLRQLTSRIKKIVAGKI